jgi:anaerobic selenocysteine-containing dehydrogenase
VPNHHQILGRTNNHPRCTLPQVVDAGYVDADHQLPAPWVDQYVERLGGWRLAPAVLVEQLARIVAPAPLVFTPRRQVRKLNSQLGYLGEPAAVLVHPDDAAAAGVVDGAAVVVRSERGEITGVARVDGSIRRGAVSVPHGHEGANVNRLTDKDDIDRTTGMAHYSGVPVTLHPAGAS